MRRAFGREWKKLVAGFIVGAGMWVDFASAAPPGNAKNTFRPPKPPEAIPQPQHSNEEISPNNSTQASNNELLKLLLAIESLRDDVRRAAAEVRVYRDDAVDEDLLNYYRERSEESGRKSSSLANTIDNLEFEEEQKEAALDKLPDSDTDNARKIRGELKRLRDEIDRLEAQARQHTADAEKFEILSKNPELAEFQLLKEGWKANKSKSDMKRDAKARLKAAQAKLREAEETANP